MNSKRMRAALLQTKYGAGIGLLVVDLVLMLFLAIDIWKIYESRLNYLRLVCDEGLVNRFNLDAWYNGFNLMFLPIALTLVGNFFVFRKWPQLAYRNTMSTNAKGIVLIIHFVTVAACVIHIASLDVLRDASGLCGSLDDVATCFTSPFVVFGRKWQIIVAIALGLFGAFGKDFFGWANEDFRLWRELGAAGEYQPVPTGRMIYANCASMAPSIKAIDAITQSYHRDYQNAVPTSDAARRLLLQKAGRARDLLSGYLFRDDSRRKGLFSIDLFSGTSRALEAGILRIGDIRQVVLSQYEHPSQIDVADWLCATGGIRVATPLYVESPAFFDEPREKQREAVVSGILSAIQTFETGRVAVILSEVHYLTGMEVDVGEIIAGVRRSNEKVIFIVDASQAVGNLAEPLGAFVEQLGIDDLYYFSAHKWLLSPNTCGVVVSQSRNEGRRIQPYDVFGPDLPTSTIDPNTVFGLVAALEVLFGSGELFERLHAMSAMSRDYFVLLGARSRFEVLRCANCGLKSLFLAVRPRPGLRWKYRRARFWESIRGVLEVTVIPEASPFFPMTQGDEVEVGGKYFLRVSFPYFLLGREVKRLVSLLNGLLEDATK